MTVRLHIERLVIEGLNLGAAERARLERAIAEELSVRFAAEAEVTWSSFAVPALPPVTIVDAPRESGRALGRSVAAALHGGLKQ